MNETSNRMPAAAALAIAAALAVAGSGAGAAGGQRVLDRNGRCAITVPADLQSGSVKSSVSSPDNGVSAVITSNTSTQTLAELKPLATQVMKPVKTYEDSAHRLWYQYEFGAGSDTKWYVAVPGHAGVCLSQVSFKSPAGEAAAKAVALSLAPVE